LFGTPADIVRKMIATPNTSISWLAAEEREALGFVTLAPPYARAEQAGAIGR
jgi:hypothetical protein